MTAAGKELPQRRATDNHTNPRVDPGGGRGEGWVGFSLYLIFVLVL